MGVVTTNPYMQEIRKFQDKLSEAKDEEERKVISRELEITKIKKGLANSRLVRQRNLLW